MSDSLHYTTIALAYLASRRWGEFMRKTLGLMGTSLLLAGPACAADLAVPVPTPVYKAPILALSWDGWYVGGNVGYAFSNGSNVDTTSTNTFAFPASFGPNVAAAITALSNFSAPAGKSGFIGGGQFGRNWQFSHTWVAGFEADIQGLSDKGSFTGASSTGVPGFNNTITQLATLSKEVDYLGTLRGRLGFLAAPSMLVYGTGGLAYGGVQGSTSVAQSLPGTGVVPPNWAGAGAFSDTRIGWTAGGGVEWMFGAGWSAKAEYLHYDLGSVGYGVSPLVTNAQVASPFTVNTVQSKTSFSGDIVRAGVNYHF
jgi:outer membrane immunogenic protein